jgi:hypothetical protein
MTTGRINQVSLMFWLCTSAQAFTLLLSSWYISTSALFVSIDSIPIFAIIPTIVFIQFFTLFKLQPTVLVSLTRAFAHCRRSSHRVHYDCLAFKKIGRFLQHYEMHTCSAQSIQSKILALFIQKFINGAFSASCTFSLRSQQPFD